MKLVSKIDCLEEQTVSGSWELGDRALRVLQAFLDCLQILLRSCAFFLSFQNILRFYLGIGKTEHYKLPRHSSLTPICLHIHKMNFDVLRAINSYPEFEVSHNVEWRSLNYAFRYDAILVQSTRTQFLDPHTLIKWTLMYWEQETHTHDIRSTIMLNGVRWTAPAAMMLLALYWRNISSVGSRGVCLTVFCC